MASAPSTADVSVLGCLPSDKRLAVKERLLGLLPPPPPSAAAVALGQPPPPPPRLIALEQIMREHLDLGMLRSVAAEAAPPCAAGDPPGDPPAAAAAAAAAAGGQHGPSLPGVRIAIAKDAAFCFLYHDNVRALRLAGATVVFFSPLADQQLPPDTDALYLIGGYPELHAAALSANTAMIAAVRSFCARSGFVWAECGGLMYLAQQLWRRPADVATAAEVAAGGGLGTEVAEPVKAADSELPLHHRMCGVLPFDTSMTSRMSMGYCTVALREPVARLLQLPAGTPVRAQQYHFSEATIDGAPAVLVDDAGNAAGYRGVESHAFDMCMEKPSAQAAPEGAVVGRSVATYCHVHFGSDPGLLLAHAFVRAARGSQRVVSLVPSGTEMVALLLGPAEARRRLLGVSEYHLRRHKCPDRNSELTEFYYYYVFKNRSS
jgi:cobyrinic acid a,c-diamide synthase